MKIGLSRIQKLATFFNATSVRAHMNTTSFSFAFTQESTWRGCKMHRRPPVLVLLLLKNEHGEHSKCMGVQYERRLILFKLKKF
jgi:hypothetical protein